MDAGTVLGQLPKAGEWQGARRLGGGLAGRGSRGHRRDSQTQATCRHSEPVSSSACPAGCGGAGSWGTRSRSCCKTTALDYLQGWGAHASFTQGDSEVLVWGNQ